jgi:secreted Zn-dependent insulinase-like peptidase
MNSTITERETYTVESECVTNTQSDIIIHNKIQHIWTRRVA